MFCLNMFSWNDYYSAVKFNELYENQFFSSIDETLNPQNGNSYIYNCYFEKMSDENGGAILFSQIGSFLLVEKCTLLSCQSNGDSSSIRVLGGNGIIAFTCGQRGHANGNDGFSTIWEDQSRKYNSFLESSISYCQSGNINTIGHQNGDIKVKSVNLSHNIAPFYCALGCDQAIVNENNNGIDISFCSFFNNTATTEKCIRVNDQGDSRCKYEIKYSNIISNNANNTISLLGEMNIDFCSILHNVNPYFYTETNTSKITINNCHTDNKNEGGNGIFTEIETTNAFMIALTFYETGHCQNLLTHILKNVKCNTHPQKNIFIHKMISNCLFIFLLDK